MEAGLIALLSMFVGVLAGMFLGLSLAKRKKTSKRHGILNVDYVELNGRPSLWLQLEAPVDDVINQKQVLFDVTVIK